MTGDALQAADEPPRAVVAIAHPDDELFMSGTIALLAKAGVDVTLICVTRGEGGSGPSGIAELGQVREGELQHAAKVLGVHHVHVLGFPDIHPDFFVAGTTWNRERLCARLQAVFAQVKPAMIFSHGPHGGTGHPAHKEVFRAVSQVLERTDDRAWFYSFAAMPPKVFYNEFFDDDCEFYIDVRGLAGLRALSFRHHQSQLQVGEFLNPPFPRTLRKVLSALFGYGVWFTEAGRARIPTVSLAQFFRRYPFEGFVTRRRSGTHREVLEHLLKEHYHRAPRRRWRAPVERERVLGAGGVRR